MQTEEEGGIKENIITAVPIICIEIIVRKTSTGDYDAGMWQETCKTARPQIPVKKVYLGHYLCSVPP